MIRTFRCADTERIFNRTGTRRFGPDMQKVGHRKLVYLHNARNLTDLKISPGNQLELLKGDRKGQHSIRINDQWRICFVWYEGGHTMWRSPIITKPGEQTWLKMMLL